MKGLLPFLTLIGFLLGLSQGQICPPPEVLSPCICNEETEIRQEIRCEHIVDRNFNLKVVLDRASELVRDDAIFDYLYIRNVTSMTEIEEGAIQHLKFDTIFISNHPNLERISPRAFGATRNVTGWLSITNTGLNNETEVFELVNGFKNVTGIDLANNRLPSIPPNALQNLPLLTNIYLHNNHISQIGSKAFASSEAPWLTRINLVRNSLPSGGLTEDAFDGISTLAIVDLTQNEMDFLGREGYETLLDRAAKVDIGIRVCELWGCWFRRVFDCDERADWLCDKEEEYRPVIGNSFACKVGSGYLHVWGYCAGRNNRSSE